jgi:hypothetical protein
MPNSFRYVNPKHTVRAITFICHDAEKCSDDLRLKAYIRKHVGRTSMEPMTKPRPVPCSNSRTPVNTGVKCIRTLEEKYIS